MSEEEIKLMSKLQEKAIRYKFLKKNNMIFDMNKFYDDYVLFEFIQRIKQENQQLKEELNKYKRIYRENPTLYDEIAPYIINECNLENIIKQYKTVLDEIREKVEKLDYDKFVYTKRALKDSKKELLQILDKVKGE